jgi:hypothetical protein
MRFSGHLHNPDTMTQVFAYFRVSIDVQDVANRRDIVVRYCTNKKLMAPRHLICAALF